MKIVKIIKDIIIGRKAGLLFEKENKTFITQNKNFNFYKNKKIFYFGKKNKDKIFFVIRRTPGAGLFSNLSFVLCNIKIALDNKFIPVVDMENFLTWYNEKKKIKNTYNAWNYYFKNLNKYKLDDVYNSQNVIFSDNKYPENMPMSVSKSLQLVKIFNKFIRVNNNIYNRFEKFKKKTFNKKILGIHFRGSDLKSYRGHPFPATKSQIFNLIQKYIDDYDYIFLSTEEKKYLDFFKNKFKKKLIFFNSYRSYKNSYLYYPRKKHRYYLGRDILIEAMLLSSCNMFIFTNNNVSEAVKLFSIFKNQKRLEVKNGRNSNNIIICRFLWYYKSFVPKFLGGFERFL